MSENIINYRRDLHRIPELGNDTVRTAEYIKGILRNLNCEISSPIDGSVCAFFNAGRDDAIAFRSDMDALPVTEQNNIPFKSETDGRMHACGHDGHMAMLLSFAGFVDKNLSALPHNILLVFQPAEETTGGAKYICESGILDRYNVKRIFGIHLWPDLPFGKIATIEGGMMARSCEVSLTVTGKSVHIAKAEKGRDALVAVIDFIERSYKMEKTEPNHGSHRILRFGKLKSGSARNIISGESELLGSLRALDNATFELLQKRMKAIAMAVENESGCNFELHFSEGYPAVVNSAELCRTVCSELSDIVEILPEPVMIAEDFAFYTSRCESLFFFLGLGIDEPLHSPKFNFDETVLLRGAELYSRLALMN